MQNFTKCANQPVKVRNLSNWIGKMLIMLIMFFYSLSSFSQTLVSENFENVTFPPTGWSVINAGSAATTWIRSTAATLPPQYSAASTAYMRYNFDLDFNANAWAFTPTLNLVSGTSYTLDFQQAVASSSFPENLKVTIGNGQTVAAQTTTLLNLPSIINTAYIKRTITFTVPSTGTYNIGFNCYSAFDEDNIAVDEINLHVTATPSAAPTSFTATAITQTGMTIGWTDNSTNEESFRVYRSTDNVNFTQVGADIYSTTSAATGTTYSAVQTGLLAGTTYFYKIVSVLDGESSPLTGSQITNPPGNFVSTAAGGNWSATGTWAGGVVPTANDNVTIADGANVTVDITTAVALSLTVGSGAGSAAILQYDGTTTAKTLTVGGNVIINANGLISSNTASPVSAVSHVLSVGGNFTVNGAGAFNGSASANSKCNITFTGATNNSFTTSATAVMSFNTVTINKGTAAANVLDFTPGATWTATAGSQGFTITNGTLKISGTTAITNVLFNAAAYSIPSTGGLWLNNPNYIVSGQNGSPTNTGLLRISQGTFNIGTAAGNAMSGTTGQYNIEGGILNIGSRITCSGAGSYTQSGGVVNVTTIAVGNTSSSNGGLDFSTTSSSVTISGGIINLVQASTATTPLDLRFASSTINITGGTLNVGTTATATNFTFRIAGALPAVVIDNTTNNKTASLFAAATAFGNVSINSGTTLNTNGFNIGLRAAITNNGTLTANATGSSLTFQGSAAQTLALGTAITSNQVANVIINNAAGVTITPSIQVNTALTLTSGNLSSGGTLTLGAGTTASFTFINSGGSLSGTVTKNYGTGTNNFTYNGTVTQATGTELPATVATGTLTINNTAGVTLNSPLSIQSLTLTAGKLTTSTTNLLTISGTTTGNLSGGSTTAYVSGPLARTLPATTTAGTWAWPVGKSAYQLFEIITPTTNATGPVVVQAEAFDTDPAGTYNGFSALTNNRYWQVSPVTGTGAFTATGTVRLTETGLTTGTKIGQSVAALPNGSYSNVGGSVVTGTPGTISNASAMANYGTSPNSTFFVTGTPLAFTAGIYAVGPTANGSTLQPDGVTLYNGFYPTLTAAIAAANNAGTAAGNIIFELQNNYVSTSETFPLTSTYQGTAVAKLTIRPRSDNAGALSIAGSAATAVLDLNTAKFVIVDGRPGAAGSVKALTISNTNTSGAAIRFINDATDNIIRYNTLQSVNTGTTSGTVFFSTTTGANGNDNNLIDNNDIRDGATTPVNGIYSSGSTTTAATNNSNVTISNNNIFNFFAAGTANNGINISSGNTDWIISANNLYQTATRTYTSGIATTGINISNTSGNNFSVSGNFIGGTAAGAASTAWTNAGAFLNQFVGIRLSVGSTTASSVQGNTIANMNWTGTGTTTTPGDWAGIYLSSGNANIGTVTANTIGSGTGTNNVTVTTTSSSSTTFGIASASSSTLVNIQGNTIGSVNAVGSASIAHSIVGIQASGSVSKMFIDGNIIGSTSSSNSINASSALTSTTTQNVTGILVSSGTSSIVRNNTVANLNNAVVATSATTSVAQLRGIAVTSGVDTIYNNTIRDLSSNANLQTNTTTSASVIGLYVSISSGGLDSLNTIFNLSNTAASAVMVTGIHASGPGSGTNVTSRNTIYALTANNTAAVINGINISSGTSGTFRNNMIRLGLGNTNGPSINGINEVTATTNTTSFHFNTVYITGTGVTTGSSGTFAFSSQNTTAIRDYRNNIFVNARSNAGGTGKHYAIRVGGTAANPAGLTTNYNILYANGTGGFTGLFNAIDKVTLADWKTATGQDAFSFSADPKFIDPAATIPNLHINTTLPSVAEGNGIAIAGEDRDYDDDLRSGLTPTDIGADAFNGTAAVPVINSVVASPATGQCNAVPHTVTATVTVTAAPITGVTLNYAYNGTAQTQIVMTLATGSASTGTSTWTGIIPAATPATAAVTWTVSATDGTLTSNATGTAYSDDPSGLLTVSITATPSTVCAGTAVALNATISGGTAAYCTPVVVGTPGASGDYINNLTIADITNNASGDAASDYTYYNALTAHVVANGTTTYNVSLTAGGTSSTFAQQFRIWVDMNQNGIFEPAESVFSTTTSTFSPTSATGTFTIPSTAYNGITRMRVACRFSAVVANTESCQVGSVSTTAWGEFEDYNVSITGGIANPTTSATYSWSDGSGVVGTTNPLTVTPLITNSYTLSVTYGNGCTKVYAPVPVTVNPLPSAPATSPSTQCGQGVPTASASGSINGNYRWYAVQTGGTAIAGEVNSVLGTTSILTTTTFYVAISNGTCESVRTAVIASVNPPDALSASSNGPVCANSPLQLTATVTSNTNSNNYTYTWSASPASGSGIPTTVGGGSGTFGTPANTTVTPTVSGTYTYTVSATDNVQGCNTSATVTVTIRPQPVISTILATPNTICAGANVQLSATSINAAAGTATVGTTSTTSITGSPFRAGNCTANKVQYIVLASELSAAGIQPGNITSLAFDVTSAGTVVNNFTIALGSTTATTLTSTFNADPTTTVFTSAAYTPSTGSFVPLSFSTPYNWDGTSNILISICHDYACNTSGTVSMYTASSNLTTYLLSGSSGSNCSSTTGATAQANRPVMRFGAQVGTDQTASVNWVWNPGAVAGSTVTVTPAATTIYTVTATNPTTTCSSTATTTVTVTPLPSAPTTNPSTQCGQGIPTCSASGSTNGNYRWYTVPTGGTALAGEVNSTLTTTSISTTTTFYVSIKNGNCEGARTAVIATVTPADGLQATSNGPVCLGNPVTLTATVTSHPNSNNYTYTWSASPAAGSGIPTTTSGGTGTFGTPANTTVTPTTAGTYTYTVTAVDNVQGCNVSATVTVTIGAIPVVTSVTANPNTPACAGSNVILTATSINAAAGTAAVGTDNAATKISTTAVPYRTGATVGNQYKSQYLVLAGELTAAGITTGNFNSLAFTVNTVTTGGAGSMSNLTFKIANTAAASMTGTFLTPTFTTVLTLVTYVPVMGLNSHTFTTPFFWDGTSNIVVEVCGTLATSGSGCTMATATTAVNTTIGNSGAVSGCTDATGTAISLARPVMTFGGQVGTNQTASLNWSWNPGSLSGSTVTVNPVSSTTYTVIATNPSTNCSSAGSTITVTTTPAPAAPSPNNSIQCGTAVPAAFVTSNQGSTNGNNMRWYSAGTGGTLLQTGGFTYSTAVSTTTTFWVSETNGTCESLRTSVTVSVNPPDPLSAAGNGPVCGNTALQLTATVTSGTNGNVYNYVWTASPAAGSGIPSSQAGGTGTFGTPASTSITPTTAGTYTYTVTGTDATLGCVAIATVVVIVKPVPVISSTTATPATPVCAGTTVTLKSKSGTGGPGSITLGAGADVSTLSTDGTPYRVGNTVGNQFKNQYLFLASELQAAGLGAGNITSVALTVSGSGGGTISNFTIKLGTTAQTVLTSTYVAGLTSVLSLATYPASGTLTTGIQTHTFTTPFAWDGVSNIVLEMCAQLATSGSSGTLAGDTQPFNATITNTATTTNCSGTTGAGVSAVRPKVTFGGFVGTDLTSSYNWTWNPGSLSGSTVTVTPSTTTVYTVTATNAANSCSTKNTITVTVNPLPPVPSGSDGTGQCGTALSDMNVSSNNTTDPQSPPFFRWYNAPTGGTLMQAGTSTTYTTLVSATIDLWIAEVSVNGCEGPRAQVHTEVSPPDPITVSASTLTVCPGQSTNISVSYMPDFNSFATYDLTATGGAASGITGSVSLTPNGTGDGSVPYAVTPTASGTYTYTVTAFDPDKGCTAVNTVIVTVTVPPLISSATATPAVVCAGTTVTLNGRSIAGANGTATLGAGSNTSTLSTDGTPYRTGNTVGNQFKNQYLFLASELQAAGLLAGNITSLQLTVAGSGGGTLSNFAIKMGATAQTALTTTYVTGLTTVLSLANYPASGTLTTGVQTHNLTTSFVWNGTSNIVLEICAQLATSGSSGTLAGDTQPFNATILNNGITTDCGSTTGSGVSTVRPKVAFGGLVGTDQTNTYNWVWNPGNINTGVTGTTTVTPSSTTTYTVTATSSATGCSATATTTVTVNPVPTAPTTNTPVTRCGPGSVTLTASGSGGTFKWYSVSTGGTALFTGASYTITVPAGTSTYYVEEMSAGSCTGPRATVTVNTGTAPTLVITPTGSTSFCQNGNVVLNAASGSSPTYTNFNWTASPATGSGLSSNTGAIVTATPTVAGTYTYTVTANDGLTNGCANIATIIVTSNPNPVISSVTATPPAVCAGGSVTLEAKSNIGAPLSIKAGTGTGGFTGAANPYWNSNSADGSKFQFLYKASDLLGLGLTAGSVSALTFKVTTATIPAAAFFDNFSISMGQTTATVMGTTWQTGMQVVKNPFYHVPVTGDNTYNFDNAFVWDGTSNIVIQVCYDNDPHNTCTCTGNTLAVEYTVASYVSSAYYYETNSSNANRDMCGSTAAATTQSNLPNVTFVRGFTNNTSLYNWQWNPGALAGAIVTANPIVTTSYTVTATDPSSGCQTVSSPVTVSIVQVAAAATATPSTAVCAGTAVTLNAGGTGGGTLSYSWASTPAGSYATTSSISVTPVTTTIYTVTVTDACNNSITSSVTVSVNPLPTAAVTESGVLNICDPSTQVLHAQTNAASPTYQWTLNGINISGATSATYTVSGVGSGTYRVIVTNTATGCISAASAAVVVNVNAQPSAVTVTPATATICNGGTVNLSATGGTISNNNAVALSENFDNSAPSWTTTNAASSPAVSNWYYQSVPYSDATGTATFSNFTTQNGGKFAYSNSDAGGSGSVTNTILTSPVFSLANYTAASLTFEHAYRYWSTGDTKVALEISTDGGTNWSTLQSYLGTSAGSITNLAQTTANVTVNLSTYLNQSNLRIRYNFVSTWGYYWILDNVKVSGSQVINTSFSWLPATGLNTTTGPNVIAAPSATTTYTATATTAQGCSNSNTAIITVNPRPTGVISGGATYCAGQGSTATTLSIAVTGSGPWNGTLSPGAIPFSGSSSPITVTVTPSSTTTYTIATLSGSQCTSIAADLTGSATVTVNPVPATPTISPAAPTAQCGSTITLTSSSATGNQWNLGGSPIGGATNQTLVVSASGNYSVTVTNAFNCSVTSAVTAVTINPVPATPTITPAGPVTQCGGTVTLTSSSATGNQWNLGGSPIGGATSQTLVVSATGIYSVTVSNGFGCSATSANTTVTINPVPATPTITPAGPVTQCGGTITLTSSSATGNQWNLEGSPISAATNQTLVVSASGNYSVTVTNGFGCSATSAVTSVTINPVPATPTVTPAGPVTQCGGTVTLTSSSATGNQWNLGGSPIGGATGQTLVASASGIYSVTVSNGFGCSATSATTTVTINPVPATPTITPAGPVTQCGGTVTLTASTPGQWQWNLEGSPIGGATNQTLVVSASGNYSVTVTNEFGCSATSAATSVTINPVPATPTITPAGPVTQCGGTVTLTSSSTTGNQWNLGGSPIGGATGQTLVVSASGIYSVTVSNGFGCSATSATTTVTINPVPATPTVTPAGPVTQCGGTVTLTSSSATGNQWNLGGSPISGATNQTLVVSASGNYSVTVTNGFGCSATSAATSVTINPVPATPTISAGGPTTFCAGGSVTLTSSSATGNQWNLNGSPIGGATNATLVVTASGDYTVTVANGFGCSATSAITTVTVNPLAANPTATVVQPTCAVGTGTINVTAPLGGGNTYSLDGINFQSSPSFPGQAPGTYTVYVHNAAGCFSPATTNVTVNPQPFVPGAPVITGIVNVCPFVGVSGPAGQLTYTATATGNGTQVFNWVVPPTNVTIVSGQGTATLVLSFQNGFATQPNKQIRLTVTNQCGPSPMTIYYLAAQIPNTPAPIVGPTDACPLLNGPAVTYTIPKAPGAKEYFWSVPQVGAGTTVTHPNGTGNVNDTMITVAYSTAFTGGTITVQSSNDCGVSGVRSITVTRNGPSQPNVISGPTNACPYITPNTPATYTVPAVPGVTYAWIASNGATVTTGQGSNSVTVSYPIGYTSGTISVTASTGCGTSIARTLTITTLNPATPGVPDVIQTHFCGESGGRKYTYTLSVMPSNATSVLWTVPAGATFINLSPVSIEVTYPNTTVSGIITIQATNPCANSVTRSVNVKLPACPTGFAGTNAGTNGTAESKGAVNTAKSTPAPVMTGTMEVRIFPNPTVSDFKLEVLTPGTEEITVRVLDNQGRLYKNFKLMPYQTIALGAELKAGSYLVEVRQGRTVKTTKVIKF